MADRKISDLTALTTPASGDFLPIVDISEAAAATKNKRITIEELMRGMPDGTAAAPGIAFENDPNTGIYSPGADTLAFVRGGVEAMRIDSSGSVGIGTSSPVTLLDISVAGGMARIGSGSGNNLIQAYTGAVGIGMWAGGNPRFYSTGGMIFSVNSTVGTSAPTGYVDAMTIDSNGNVGIGTTSPTALLDVNADTVRVRTARTPASASATGATGEICWDANYIYVCTATNTWKRTAISTW